MRCSLRWRSPDPRSRTATRRGPVVSAARVALDAADAKLVLHWVHPEDEPAIEAAFEHALKVRGLGPEAMALADRYFFETLVRIHRSGEGAPYTGLSDGDPDPIIAATDLALERASAEQLEQELIAAVRAGLAELNPPQNAVVLSVLDLYAALNVVTGEVSHQCTERHTAKEFLGFLRLLARQYRGQELHVILDNSSAHATRAVQRWLECHPKIQFHYTPTSASWLNQVEALFSILTRQSLRHGDFRNKTALRKHIEAFLDCWNQSPTPFIWTKKPHRLIRDHRRMLARISHAPH